MKTKIYINGRGNVIREFWNSDRNRLEISEYYSNGCYVFERSPNGQNDHQVCQKLYWTGSTLTCKKDDEKLLALIRRENKARRISDRKTNNW